tara:strand:- start:354 stop:494 length:141 start_codon:yes stop_codon:yes gene_type:complete
MPTTDPIVLRIGDPVLGFPLMPVLYPIVGRVLPVPHLSRQEKGARA